MKRYVFCFFASLLAATPVMAQSDVPAAADAAALAPAKIPGATADRNLNAGPGECRYTVIDNLGDANALRTSLIMVANNNESHWVGEVQINLFADPKDPANESTHNALNGGNGNDSDGDLKNAASIIFKNEDDSAKADGYQATLKQYNDTGYAGQGYFNVRAFEGKPVPIAIDWNADGTVFASVGDSQRYRIKLRRPVAKIRFLACVTQIRLSPFLLAHTGSPVP
jgi:hypothetical protein